MRIVRRPLFPGEFDHELVWLTISLVGFALGMVWLRLHLPFPRCPFLEMTGYPCLTCGATRCTIALSHGNLATAFVWNPLALIALCGVAAFDVYAAFVLVTRAARLRITNWTRLEKNSVRIAVVILLVVNWAYLLAHRTQY